MRRYSNFRNHREKIEDFIKQQNVLAKKARAQDLNTHNPKSGFLFWGFYDENQLSFTETFREVLGKHLDINAYLKDRFPNRNDLVLVEIGGPGYNLRRSMSQVSRSFAVCLEDYPTTSENSSLNSHTVISRVPTKLGEIPADLTRPETFRALSQIMNGQKADVLIERLWGGWNYIRKDPNYLFFILKKYYKLMAANSVMLIQLIDFDEKDIVNLESWIDLMNSTFGNNLKLFLSKNKSRAKGKNIDILKIERYLGSPDNLSVSYPNNRASQKY